MPFPRQPSDAARADCRLVYGKPCLTRSQALVDCLARYTQGIATSEARLLALEADGRVRLAVKDYADGGHRKCQVLAGPELRPAPPATGRPLVLG